jgi:hypothetical protein
MTLATVFAYLQAAFCALQKLYQHNVYFIHPQMIQTPSDITHAYLYALSMS